MPLESTNTIDGLDSSWPLNGDTLAPGAAHIRLVKSVLQNIFPGVGGNGFNIPITATEIELNYTQNLISNLQTQIDNVSTDEVPINAMLIYTGLAVNIPSNYQLADGTNGTVNLTDQFILGANASGVTGGSADKVGVTHTHGITHTHALGFNTTGDHIHTADTHQGAGGGFITAPFRGAGGSSFLLDDAGAHSHTVGFTNTTPTTDSSGTAGTDLNRPVYIQMAYIVRMS